jgi:hypothetical protein
MTELVERPFGELPTALVNEVLKRTEDISQKLLGDFEQVRARRQEWREDLERAGLLRHDAELPYMPIPTTCGIDGSYAVERLLASDLAAAAAVAVEGLTPPSETRYWPEPRHLVWIETEAHEAETGTILRALMIGMELELASQAPHEVVFLDGSLTTPLIYFNQALNKSRDAIHLKATTSFLDQMTSFLEAYLTVLSFLLEPGEYTDPRPLQQPTEPWHLNLTSLAPITREAADRILRKIILSLGEIQVVYYRPYPWLPALRVEMSRAVAENQARLATALHGVRHQCGAPAVMEPYPLYVADRMVKHLPKAIPTFRQVTSQYIAETYQGNIGEVFLGLHGYRTESGV